MNTRKTDGKAAAAAEFELRRPTGELAGMPAGDRPGSADDAPRRAAGGPPSDPDLPHGGWKGLEEEEEPGPPEDHVSFSEGGFRSEGDLDMTPMVDVTFLLLIFFMVTASFSLMRTLQQAPPQVDDPSTQAQESQDDFDYVEVIIDQNNSYFVTTRGEEEREAPSDNEMRALVRNARNDYNIEKMIVTCHVDSSHARFVTAWDAGLAAGMTEMKRRTTEQDY